MYQTVPAQRPVPGRGPSLSWQRQRPGHNAKENKMARIYDTIIVGGGPAGLAAALYASRSKMDTLLIEKSKYGGLIMTTDDVENYPGAPKDSTGPSIVARMKEQAETFGTHFIKDDITGIADLGPLLKTASGVKDTYQAKSLIIASGATPRPGGFKNELEFRGRGVSYCATCDAFFFEDLHVAVLGGGDAAVKEAIYLTKFAETVTLIHRRDQLRAGKALQEEAFANPKIKFIWDTVVEEAAGADLLDHLVIKNRKTGEISNLEVDGCFVFIGYTPITSYINGAISLDDKGYIQANADMTTNVPGIFAAGDVCRKSLKQVITAAADGAIAATSAEEYISLNKQPEREA